MAAAAALVGGGLMMALLAMQPGGRDADSRQLFMTADRAYEWIFAAALALLVATGIGNLGAFGLGLPPAGERWGTVLTVKLLSVVALTAFGAVRALALVVASEHPRTTTSRGLRAAYLVTAADSLVILVLAEVLAHG